MYERIAMQLRAQMSGKLSVHFIEDSTLSIVCLLSKIPVF